MRTRRHGHGDADIGEIRWGRAITHPCAALVRRRGRGGTRGRDLMARAAAADKSADRVKHGPRKSISNNSTAEEDGPRARRCVPPRPPAINTPDSGVCPNNSRRRGEGAGVFSPNGRRCGRTGRCGLPKSSISRLF